MDLSIIIVSYNVYNELRNCIISIFEILKGIEYEIIVVDNASPDRAINGLNTEFPAVKFIQSESNIGFGAANNLGATAATGRNLLVLNPDTLLTENFVLPVVEFIEKNNNAGACGPMLLNQNGSYQNSTGFRMGLIYELFESLMLNSLYRFIRKNEFEKKRQFKKPVRVGWVSAACMLISKESFLEVKGFSSEYFLNYEDLELCRKLEDKGLTNYYFPYLECIHLDHKSFGSNYSSLIYSRYQSRIKFASVYYSVTVRFFIRVFMITGLLIRIFVSFLSSGKESKERSKGYKNSLRLCFREKL